MLGYASCNLPGDPSTVVLDSFCTSILYASEELSQSRKFASTCVDCFSPFRVQIAHSYLRLNRLVQKTNMSLTLTLFYRLSRFFSWPPVLVNSKSQKDRSSGV